RWDLQAALRAPVLEAEGSRGRERRRCRAAGWREREWLARRRGHRAGSIRGERVTEDGDFSKELVLAEAVAREAGALLKENFGREQEIEYKGRINLVTEMDRR